MMNVAERSLSLRGRRGGSLNAAVRRRRRSSSLHGVSSSTHERAHGGIDYSLTTCTQQRQHMNGLIG